MDRRAALRTLDGQTFDLLVIGGGITGAGVAREASLRGFRVALVERRDFASGTSSRSTKLIHGGLRYLKQFDFKLVAEAVRERQLLLRTAPHIVEPTPFLFPVYGGDPDSLVAVGAGLLVYDVFARLEARHRMLGPSAVLAREPQLRGQGLTGGALYTDSRTDDARLTLAVLQSAHAYGAAIANYVEVDAFERLSNGCVSGARLRDALTGECLDVRARRIVAAVGPWADELRRLEHPQAPAILRLTKGIHVTVRAERLPIRHAVVIRSRDRERRMMFAIPRGSFTYIGTTDTDFDGCLEALDATAAEVQYVLAAANAAFPSANLTEDDVVSTWAGLRPLLRPRHATSPSAVSRDYALFRGPSGLITIGGGKLTAFRAMAEHIVDQILPGSGDRRHRQASRTALPGSDAPLPTDDAWQCYADQTATTREQLREWCSLYGSYLADVAARLPAGRSDDAALDWHRAMTRYAVDSEMAQRLEDVYLRRTGLMLFSPDNGRKWLEPLSLEMASLLGWSAERRLEEVSSTAAAIDRMFAFREGPRKPTLQSEFVGRN